MTLRSFRVANFKCFADTPEIEIKPLTLVVGPNNSGKSSLLQSMYLPAQTLRSEDPSLPLRLTSDEVDFGTFSDLAHMHALGQPIRFHFTADGCRSDVPERTRTRRPKAHYDYCGQLAIGVGYMPKRKQIFLNDFKATITDGPWLSVETTDPYRGSIRVDSSSALVRANAARIRSLMHAWNFLFLPQLRYTTYRRLQKSIGDQDAESLFSLLDDLAFLTSEIRWQLYNTFYLGPLRLPPSRSYTYSGERPRWVGSRGDRAMQVLALLSTSTAADDRERLTRIQDDLAKLGFVAELKLEEISARHFETWTRHPESGLTGNLADTGFGASQVLPVIVSIRTCVDQALCLYEQPEIHLHPGAQAALGSILVRAIQLYPEKRFIVETHSENMILRILREVVESARVYTNEDSDDLHDMIAIYFVEPGKGSHEVSRIDVDRLGRFSREWPRGFFEDGYHESSALARARLEFQHD